LHIALRYNASMRKFSYGRGDSRCVFHEIRRLKPNAIVDTALVGLQRVQWKEVNR